MFISRSQLQLKFQLQKLSRMFLILSLIGMAPVEAAIPKRPKLILTLVIDQFRADNLTRFEKIFMPAKNAKGEVGGFGYLLNAGAFFPQGQYDLLQPMTGPGHATILSGSYPYLAGIPVNGWYDSVLKDMVYCVEDRGHKVVGSSNTNIHTGTSPKNFLGTTVGDELKNAGHPSKVISIAVKDRAAILMGGHRSDLSLWYDSTAGQWVSSSFYLPEGKLPEWVETLNADLKQRKGTPFLWEAKEPASGLSLPPATHPKYGYYFKSIGSEDFPHQITEGTSAALSSPIGLYMTEKAAVKAVDFYKLGQGKSTDLLAVSFSSHDYVGHAFGPNSRENEEMVKAEDQVLSRLFNHIRKKVPGGLENVVIVLTADHGVSPVAEWLSKERIEAKAINMEEVNKQVESHLAQKFGKVNTPWLSQSEDFNFWINREQLEKKGVESAAVEEEIKKVLLTMPYFTFAFSATDYKNNKLPPGVHERRIKKTFFAGRSGDVIAIARPFHYVKEATGTHMAAYSYDETVPILFAGPRIKPGDYGQRAEVVDIAPTLSFLLGILTPSLSEGRVLTEILK